MDLFFADPNEIPLPPEEVRIREFSAVPWPDGRRVRIVLVVDPFQKRPSAKVMILNAAGETVAEITVIEAVTRELEFNMHLRQAQTAGRYIAQAVLYYQKLPEAPEGEAPPPPPEEPMLVDRSEAVFEIPT
jgi:hypothetical protein